MESRRQASNGKTQPSVSQSVHTVYKSSTDQYNDEDHTRMDSNPDGGAAMADKPPM